MGSLKRRVVITGAGCVTSIGNDVPTTWQAQLEWAVVHDVYAGAGEANALERLAPFCTSAGQRAQLQQWLAERGAVRAARKD